MIGAGERADAPRILPEIYRLRPWYHDFSALGLETRFEERRRQPVRAIAALWRALARLVRPNGVEKGERLLSRASFGIGTPSHLLNQRAKEAVLIPMLGRCVKELGPRPRCLDLFCADGYYSCTIAGLAPTGSVVGIDLDPLEIDRARAASKALDVANVEMACADAGDWIDASEERFDLILCAGGLYHLSRPDRLLASLRKIAGRYLVLQSVVSLEREEPDYFEAPAPGWRHGSRFSHARLAGWLERSGWIIVDQRRGELPGNRRACDRGSSYFICRPEATEAD